MRFLVGIKDTLNETRSTLRIAAKIANGFSADISVIYIGNKPKEMMANEVEMARKSLSDWQIYHPGIEVLHWAFEALKEFGFLAKESPDFKSEHLLEDKGRFRMILPDVSGEKIRFILREGDLLNELKKETETRDYELAIIGASEDKRKIHKLIQFLDTSVLIVKNFRKELEYKVLLCVDDSKATRRAVIFGARTAKHLNAEVEVITVSKRKDFGKGYLNAHKWVLKYLRLQKIKHAASLVNGNPVDAFLAKAGHDHIIVMGKGTQNEFLKFFRGSKSIHTAQLANCPVLVVKPFDK